MCQADAKAMDERRTLAEDEFKGALTASRQAEADSNEAMDNERKASLEAIKTLQTKASTVQTYWVTKGGSIQAKCNAQKAVATQCADTEKLLELEAKKDNCENLKTWRQWLANNTAHVNYIKTKEMYRDEHDKLRGCQHLLHASRNATNFKIRVRPESEMSQPLPEIT